MSTLKDVVLPREAGRFIAENCDDVKICDAGVKGLAKHIVECVQKDVTTVHVDRWKTHELNPKTEDQAAVDCVFFTDFLNFSFWADDQDKKFTVKYNGKDWTGYMSLCAALKRAQDDGIPLSDPKYFSTITKEQLEHVFQTDSQTPMPMLEKRLELLHQAGKVLIEKYDGTFVNMINKCDKSAQRLIQLLLEEFPSFRDLAEFKGKTVALYKRVQILIADTWACCAGKGIGEFTDIDNLTAFADYRVPQALVWFDALKYSDRLMDILNKDTMMQSGDQLEVEIRGCTIRVCDMVVEEVKCLLAADSSVDSSSLTMNAIVVDHYLWDLRREHAKETAHIPFHKVRCVYY